MTSRIKHTWLWLPLIGVLGFVSPTNAQACEPILPFIKVVGGPGMLTSSWLVLTAAIFAKTLIFAISQSELSRARAAAYMFTGNVLTTGVGVIAAAMIGSGPIMFVGVFLVWGLSVLHARRLLLTSKIRGLKHFAPSGLAAVMSLGLALSCVFFALSTEFADSKSQTVYWLWKLAAIYPALIISIILTAFWEEWTIWKFSKRSPDFSGFVRPVTRANLVVLLGVMVLAAGMAMPKRLGSPDFLISVLTQCAPVARSR